MLNAKQKEILKTLVTELNQSDSDSLWEVVSALRGPDNTSDSDIKASTTAVLRSAIGLKSGQLSIYIYADNPTALRIRQEIPIPLGFKDSKNWHFNHHIKRAFHALGLDWNSVNEDRNYLEDQNG